MQCPVLKRRDGVWSVNIHSSITTLLEEAKWMQRLGLEVPDAVYQLSIANVKSNCDQLKVQYIQLHGILCTTLYMCVAIIGGKR